jgi:hypothetical protein
VTSVKWLALASVLFALLASTASTRGSMPDSTPRSEPAASARMPPRTATIAASYELSACPLYSVDLAPGDGHSEVASYCDTCHSPRYITVHPLLPADAWPPK